MPFILPYQRTKISNSTRFSKYKNVDESSFFLLQKLKSTFRSADSPTYRIITQHYPYYEVANGMELAELRDNWSYLVNKLPSILPTQLPPKLRQAWFIAHFTQLALETAGPHLSDDAAANYPFNISHDDEDDEDHKHSTGVPLADSSSLSSFTFGSPASSSSSSSLSLSSIASPHGVAPSSSSSSLGIHVTTNSPLGPSGASTPAHGNGNSHGAMATTPLSLAASSGNGNGSGVAQSSSLASSSLSISSTPHGIKPLANDNVTADQPSRMLSSKMKGNRDGWLGHKLSLPRRDGVASNGRKRRSIRISSTPPSSLVHASTGAGAANNGATGSTGKSIDMAANDNASLLLSSLPSVHHVRGAYVWAVLCMFTNIVWLLLRDARWEIFLVALFGINVLVYLLVVRGRPCTIGVLFITTDTLQHNMASLLNQSTSRSSPSSSSSSLAATAAMLPSMTTTPSHAPQHSGITSDDDHDDDDDDGDAESDSRGSDIDITPVARQTLQRRVLSSSSSTATPSPVAAVIPAPPISSRSILPSQSSPAPASRSSAPLPIRSVLPDTNITSPSSSSPLLPLGSRTSPGNSSRPISDERDGKNIMRVTNSPAMTFSLINNKLPAGITLTRAPHGGNTWYQLDGTTFQVRCGPNYKRNKTKKNSQMALFEFVGADCFATPNGKQLHIMQHISLPSAGTASMAPARTTSDNGRERKSRGSDADDTPAPSATNTPAATAAASGVPLANGHGLPTGIVPYFVVNLMLPAYAPSNPIWGSAVEDGVGYSLLLYFAMTERTKEIMMSAKPTPSVALLRRFLAAHPRGEEIDELRRRLKCIPRLGNVDDVNLGMTKTLVNNYNAKPFMTGPRCHIFHKGVDYLEVDVDVHRFSYLARKGIWSMWDSLPDMELDIGFVVEAQAEEEMPEQVLGVARVNKLQMNTRSIGEWRALAANQEPSSSSSSAASSSLASSTTTSSVNGKETAPSAGVASLSTLSLSPTLPIMVSSGNNGGAAAPSSSSPLRPPSTR